MMLRWYARSPLLLHHDESGTKLLEPTIAFAVADALVASGRRDRRRARSIPAVVNDMGLTTRAATLTQRSYSRRPVSSSWEAACPCGRGPASACEHRWGGSAPTVTIPLDEGHRQLGEHPLRRRPTELRIPKYRLLLPSPPPPEGRLLTISMSSARSPVDRAPPPRGAAAGRCGRRYCRWWCGRRDVPDRADLEGVVDRFDPAGGPDARSPATRGATITICTTVAPDPVFTVRIRGHRPTLRPPIRAQLRQSRTVNQQVSDPQDHSRQDRGPSRVSRHVRTSPRRPVTVLHGEALMAVRTTP